MALGESSGAPEEVEEAFRASGSLHVFAVSGLHVGIFGLIAWLFILPMRLPRRWAVLALIPCLFGYAFITGWRPPPCAPP
ncbi:MAG: ComEC/Rec2 family competence protein [Verrucomicrobiales bacterium]